MNNKSIIYLVENDVSCTIVVNKCKLCSDKEQISCGLRMHLANHYRGMMSDIKMDEISEMCVGLITQIQN